MRHVRESREQRGAPGLSGAKVTSSHKRGETVILAEAAPEEARLRQVIEATGYTVGEITACAAEKKGLFGFLRR